MKAAVPPVSNGTRRVLELLRSPGLHRAALAGPGALLTTMAVLLGLSVILPHGAAGINQIAFPLVLFPLVWGILFFHACLDRSLRRAALLSLVLFGINAFAITWHVVEQAQPVTMEKAR